MISRFRYAFVALIILTGCSSPSLITKTEKIAGQAGDLTITSTVKKTSERGFILGVGDEVKVTVWKHDDLNRVLRIDPAGKVFYPLVGEIAAAGLSAGDLRNIITKGLSGYIKNPQVSVRMQAFRSRKVYVLGEVHQPGVMSLEDPMHIMDGLLLAGGFTRDADEKKVILVRSYPEQIELHTVNVMDLLKKGDSNQLVKLQKGDIIYVPPSFIANVDRFFEHVYAIFRPIVSVERSIILGDEIKRIIEGRGAQEKTIIISP